MLEGNCGRDYSAALYVRLSRDDENPGESTSIHNQKKLLLNYARENNIEVYDIYTDDGYSGTSFQRPAFQRMIEDIEEKKVNMVLTKDLSRLGRDYIKTGEYTEVYFPSRNVRYIALNDGYDTEKEDDTAPFRNIINEMYARDISKKIRSALRVKMQEGDYIGHIAPYGYRKDKENKNHLVIDTESAPTVKDIFQMAAEGCPATEIAARLEERNVLPPLAYMQKQKGAPVREADMRWRAQTIRKMLVNPVYMGHTIQGKTRKLTFKQKKSIQIPQDSWITVLHTHEAIIDKETFYEVLEKRRRNTKRNRVSGNVFSGLAKCRDCGRNMSPSGKTKDGKIRSLVCSGYKMGGREECASHIISYEDLLFIVLSILKEGFMLSDEEWKGIADEVILYFEEKEAKKDSLRQKKAAELEAEKRRLDLLSFYLYQDYASGVLSEEKFRMMQEEQKRMEKRIEEEGRSSAAEKEGTVPNLYNIKKAFDAISFNLILNQYNLYRFIERIEIGGDRDSQKMSEKEIYIRLNYSET